ncbi:MAG TPA: division/cell wall cluster transcriptional repressor MraZ [Anaerolineae bacterium]|nr:division/cell wall cluster transcriptional repressor MraZ [Anaerolineae bacterium]
MFLGEYQHTIDKKNRITIPSKYRDDFADGLVVTRGLDQNLMGYTMSGWLQLAQQIAQQPLSNQDARSLRRRLFAGAIDLTLDKQGRILLPNHLREFAQLETDIIIAGMYNYIEFWTAPLWQQAKDAAENNENADRWTNLGI